MHLHFRFYFVFSYFSTERPRFILTTLIRGLSRARLVIFGAAGFLVGKKATTHPIAFEELKPYCLAVEDLRIVDEENIITSRGVSSAIDVGLYLVEKLVGKDVREKIATQMDYPYFYQK